MSSSSTGPDDLPGHHLHSSVVGRKVVATGGWKKRKLVLTDQYLAWYKIHQEYVEEARLAVKSPDGEPLLTVRDVSVEAQEPNSFSVSFGESVYVFQTAMAADFFDWIIVLQQFACNQVDISYDNKLDVTESKRQRLLTTMKAPPPKPPTKPPAKPPKSIKSDPPQIPSSMVENQVNLSSVSQSNAVNGDDRPFADQLPSVLKTAHVYSLLLEPNIASIQQYASQSDYQNAIKVIYQSVESNTDITKYVTERERGIVSTVLNEFGFTSPALLLTQLTLHFLLCDQTLSGLPKRQLKAPPSLPLGFFPEKDTPTVYVSEDPQPQPPVQTNVTPVVVEPPKRDLRNEKPPPPSRPAPKEVIEKPIVPPTKPKSGPSLTITSAKPSADQGELNLDAISSNRRRLSVITKVKSVRLSNATQLDVPSEPVPTTTSTARAPRAGKRPGKRPPSRRNNSDLLLQVEQQAAQESLTEIKEVKPTKEPEATEISSTSSQPSSDSQSDKERILARIAGNRASLPVMGMMGIPMMLPIKKAKALDEEKQEEEQSPSTQSLPQKPATKPPPKPSRPPPTELKTEETSESTGGNPETPTTPSTYSKRFSTLPNGPAMDFQAAIASKIQGVALKRMSIDERKPATPTEEPQQVDFRANLKRASVTAPLDTTNLSGEQGSKFGTKAPPPSVPSAKPATPSTPTTEEPQQVDFRSQLKKGPPPSVPPAKPSTATSEEEQPPQQVDFRSQLKKSTPPPSVPTKPTNPSPQTPPATEEQPVDFRSQLRKSTPPPTVPTTQPVSPPQTTSATEEEQPVDFRSQLKKSTPPPSVPTKPATPQATQEEQPVDFRSQLKKSTPPPSVPTKPSPQTPPATEEQPVDFRSQLKKSSPTSTSATSQEEQSATVQSAASKVRASLTMPMGPLNPADIARQLKKTNSTDIDQQEPTATEQQDFRSLLKKSTPPQQQQQQQQQQQPASNEAQQVDFRSLLKKRTD